MFWIQIPYQNLMCNFFSHSVGSFTFLMVPFAEYFVISVSAYLCHLYLILDIMQSPPF